MKNMVKDAILCALEELARRGVPQVSASQLSTVPASPATIRRHLDDLVTAGKVVRSGKARATRYRLVATPVVPGKLGLQVDSYRQSTEVFTMSPQSKSLLVTISQPLAARSPVTYRRSFVDQYVPNASHLLPLNMAESLYREGRMRGQQPAGTYARRVLEQLLIDLSWSSSRLEGNRRSLLDTAELFKRGTDGGDADAVMLLNHKRAIEFLVDAVPEYGLSGPLIRNLHALLMQDLLAEPQALGEIRTKIVNISDTTYIPSQMPSFLEEMLNVIITRAQQIKNPVEAAFFIWLNLAYLQPFEDGNKRTSRLAANIPLMLYNCAPLSFLDVDIHDYAHAMIGVYECLDTSLAADLFEWTYKRSIQKYAVVMESVGSPDPFRLAYRDQLTLAIQVIVQGRQGIEDAFHDSTVPEVDRAKFRALLNEELKALTLHNCARHRLSIKLVDDWIARGRPL